MTDPMLPDEFDNLVMKHYNFLADDFGFSIQKIFNYKYVAETSKMRILIYLEHVVNLMVELEPIGEGASQLLRKNILPESVSVILISRHYDPSLKYKIEMLDEEKFISNISVELEKRANLLTKYCTKILSGDLSDWPE